jgi:hypothetical protein
MLTDYALDTYVAPELSRLGVPIIPSLASLHQAAATWLPEFLLNHMLRSEILPRERQFRFGLIRRTVAAVADYELARIALSEYSRNLPRVTSYFSALRHLEATVATTYQALALGAALVKRTKALFTDESSPYGRLFKVYVHSRHAHELFDSDQVPPELSMTVWLTHDGLKCVQATVLYTELAAMIEEIGRVSQVLVDPSKARPKDHGSEPNVPCPAA